MSPTIDPQPETIGHVIADKKPVVPLRQRHYSWKEEEVSKLFADLDAAIDRAEDYFLGLIVVSHQDPNPPEVVDGQQRLATAVILLAAIRDFLLPIDVKLADGIHKTYLMSYDIDEEMDKSHLRLNVEDQPYFVARVLSKPDSQERKKAKATLPSHNNIDAAAKLASQHVATITAGRNSGEAIRRVKAWETFIRKQARVIWFAVPDHRHAFIIFETLNDRGLELSKSDLLKNYLFSCVREKEQESIHGLWSGMQGALRSVTIKEDITATYVRHYWITQKGPVREDALYDSLKDAVRNADRAMELAESLRDNARVYAALLNSDHNMWAEYGAATRKNLSTLQMLNMVRMRPLMLAIVRAFPVRESKRAFSLLVSWAVRWIIAGTAAGTMEKEFGRLAKEVADGNLTTAKALSKGTTVIPTDAQFEERFTVARASELDKARYYLRAMENKRKGKADPWVLSDDPDVLNLEHIWPESPKDTGLPAERVNAMNEQCTRLGNMALMRKKPNEDAGNLMFKDKLPFYAKEAGMELTTMLTKYTKWTPDEIDDRQRYLAQLAVKTWPLAIE